MGKKNNKWIQVGSIYKAKLGRKGLATGLGLTADTIFNQPISKAEGDGKTPTGIFSIGQVYGKASAQEFKGTLPYTQATKDYIGIDDPKSKYYNQIIRKSQTSLVDWDSNEEIYHPPTYNWLLEVDHNPQNLSAKGSLIFFHATRPLLFLFYKTAGCVAIQTKNLIQVLRWINPEKNPKFVIIDSTKEIEFKNLLKARSLN